MKSKKTKQKLTVAHLTRDSGVPAALEMTATIAEFRPLALPSMFWKPDFLDPGMNFWIGHIPFAFWVVEALRPRCLVELGTHTGNSYFSFCQAVDRLSLICTCFAVDTWAGDQHTGAYGEGIFAEVHRYNANHYAGFSTLVRSTFDEALPHFEDSSIDLLHIDGTHTFEAVRHDFETWLPKLSGRAVVLLHDTNVRFGSFGVSRFFARLKSEYPWFEFHHSNGLGIVAVGREQPEHLQNLFQMASSQSASGALHQVFARLGQACLDLGETKLLQKRVVDSESHLQGKAIEIARLQETCALERGRLAERITALEREKDSLAACSFELTVLQKTNEEAEGKLQALTQEREAISREKAELESQLEGAGKAALQERVEFTEKLTALQKTNEEAEGKLQALTQEREAISREKAELESKLEGAGKAALHERVEFTEKLTALQQTNKQVEEKLKALTQELKGAEHNIRERFEELAILTRRNLDLKSEYDRLARKADDLVVQLEESTSRYHSMRGEFADRLSKWEDQNAQLVAEVNEKTQRLDQYIKESAQMARMIVDANQNSQAWRQTAGLTAQVDQILPGITQEHGEHQHIHYTFREISHLGRQFSSIDLRIVEHSGHAGVAIFEPPSGERSFYGWEKSGEEAGRGYLLIIPSEIKGADWLVRATSNDLILFKDLVTSTMQHLHTTRRANKWIAVCERILNQIEDLPVRLHYDDVRLISEENGIKKAEIIHPSHRCKLLMYKNVFFKGKNITRLEGENKAIDFKSKNLSREERGIKGLYLKETKNLYFHIQKGK